MHSIRKRLLISHSLPLLIFLLLTGLALDYVLETRVLLPGFADELTHLHPGEAPYPLNPVFKPGVYGFGYEILGQEFLLMTKVLYLPHFSAVSLKPGSLRGWGWG